MKLLTVPGRKQTEIEKKLKTEVTPTLSWTGRKTINLHSNNFLKKQHEIDRELEETDQDKVLKSKDAQARRDMVHDILDDDYWMNNPEENKTYRKRTTGKTSIQKKNPLQQFIEEQHGKQQKGKGAAENVAPGRGGDDGQGGKNQRESLSLESQRVDNEGDEGEGGGGRGQFLRGQKQNSMAFKAVSRNNTSEAVLERQAQKCRVENKYKPSYKFVERENNIPPWKLPDREFEFYYSNNDKFRHGIEMNIQRESSQQRQVALKKLFWDYKNKDTFLKAKLIQRKQQQLPHGIIEQDIRENFTRERTMKSELNQYRSVNEQ